MGTPTVRRGTRNSQKERKEKEGGRRDRRYGRLVKIEKKKEVGKERRKRRKVRHQSLDELRWAADRRLERKRIWTAGPALNRQRRREGCWV